MSPMFVRDSVQRAPIVAFSPDGTRLATASWDQTARLYTHDIDDLVALAQTRVTRSLTAEECRRYLHVERCPGSR